MGCSASATETNPRPVSPQPQRVVAIPNGAISPSIPYNNGPQPISTAQLDAQRADFWATRVDGSALMWQAIKSAAEASIAGDTTLAMAILEASNISLPNGSLELCYDERGFQYKIPIICFTNPIDVINDEESSVTGRGMVLVGCDSAKTVVVPDYQKNIKVVEEKSIIIKIRVNPGDVNMVVVGINTDSVLEFKKKVLRKVLEIRIQAPENCATEALASLCAGDEGRLRLIFMGRELQSNTSLGDVGLDEVRVLQVFLRPTKKKAL